MTDRPTDVLISTYLDTREWKTRREPVDKTSTIIRELTGALLENSTIGTQELTALYRLCMNNSTYPVSSKRGEIDELPIPDGVKKSLKEQIDEQVGTVGGLLFPVEVPDDKEEAVSNCFEELLSTDDPDRLNAAVLELAELDLPKVECGKLSPILYYLHPTYYPVVNNLSRTGMAEHFDESISNSLTEYPDTAATYRSIRDASGFQDNFRDLDYFFIWVNQRERSREDASVSTDRSYYWVNQGNQAEIRDEYVRAKVDDVWHHDLARLDTGDVVFHNFDDELVGISTVTDWREEYNFKDETYQRVGVEFRWLNESVAVDDDLKSSLNKPEFRAKYSPVNSKGNLKQAYLSDLTPVAAEFLLDRIEGWSQLQDLDSERESDKIVPARPDQAGEITRQLEEQMQIVFYGPPGTGKTYTAERFAQWWTAQQESTIPADERVETVTFHPSFTYEDFIEGLSAEATNGQVAYEVQDGILKRLSKKAADAYKDAQAAGADPPRFVLVIDEINRGNLAQIFGETITLLEGDKRGVTTVRLAHSDSEFTLPPNLYVIGTMNTADRSIALVDAALRRRFRFIASPPDFETVIQEYGLPKNPLQDGDEFELLLGLSIAALREMNDRIVRAADLGKGKQIGHTRLFGVETTEDIRDVWRFDILPLLEEYYFGQFDRIQQELFDGAGGELFDWERKQIRNFGLQELADALAEFSDGNLDIRYEKPNSDTESSGARKQWDRELFFETIESSFDQEVVDVYHDFYDFGTKETDSIDYGTGKQTGSVQFYSDEYQNGNYLLYEIRTDGSLQFRFWGRNDYESGLFEDFLDQINPLLDTPIDVDYLQSDEFSRLQVPMERLRNDENREQVKKAIRDFIQHCATKSE